VLLHWNAFAEKIGCQAPTSLNTFSRLFMNVYQHVELFVNVREPVISNLSILVR
jgi:hypothetical protein